MINFISNAIKFSEVGGLVEVVLAMKEIQSNDRRRRKPSEASEVYLAFEIKIIDKGAGISEEGLKNLFLDFSVLKEHKTLNIRGTGLGLSISKKLVNKMGGKVRVESEQGTGTIFTISISTRCKIGDNNNKWHRKFNSSNHLIE